MPPGRTLLVAGLIGGVALVAGSERAGAVRLEPVPEPASLTFPRTERITYRLRIFGEEREERFNLGIHPPRFGGESVPPDRRPAGSSGPLVYGQEGVLVRPVVGQRIVFGDATPVSGGFIRGSPPRCAGYHGFEPTAEIVELVVPPRSFSEVVAPFEVTRTAPWVDSDFRMTWTAENRTRTSAPPTLEREQVVRSPRRPIVQSAPRRTGIGLRIILRTKPRSSPYGDLRTRRVKRGWSVIVYGRTLPRVPGDRLTLIARGPTGKERQLGTVRVDGAGRFRHRGWRPERTGLHEIRAVYPRQRPTVLADSSCQRKLLVTRWETNMPQLLRSELTTAFAAEGPPT